MHVNQKSDDDDDDETLYLGIMSQYDMILDLEIKVGHCDLYFMVQ